MGYRSNHRSALAIVIALGLLLTGCAALNTATTDKQLEGTVWYKERMQLPPDADVEVSLEDISKADAPATTIASTAFKASESPPWDFVLTYDPDLIKERNRYGLRAKITRNDKLLFLSTQANPVFEEDGEAGKQRILVSRVNSGFPDDKHPSPAPNTDLAGISWQLVGIGGDRIDTKAVERPLNMVFVEEDTQVHGYAGCNSFTGRYRQVEDQLMFDSIAATSMACTRSMDRERRFFQALDETARLNISNGELRLLDADGNQVLHFKSAASL